MPAKIPHPPQFSKRFLGQIAKLLQSFKLLGYALKMEWTQPAVCHRAGAAQDTKYRPKDLQSLCNNGSTASVLARKRFCSPNCSVVVARTVQHEITSLRANSVREPWASLAGLRSAGPGGENLSEPAVVGWIRCIFVRAICAIHNRRV
jgi:hypothetical protein